MPSTVPRARRERVAPAPQRLRRAIALGTPEPSNIAGRARGRGAARRARANPARTRRRSISRDSSCATRPYAILRRLHSEISRHRIREPRDHVAPSARRITTRRRLAGGVRRTGCQRLSVRGAISARVPPSSPSRATRDQHTTQQHRHTLHSERTTPMRAHPRARTRRGTRARARRPTPRSTSSPTSSSPGTPTHHRRCASRPC